MATTKFIESGSDATQDMTFYPILTLTNGTVATDSTRSKDGLRSIKANITVAAGSAAASCGNGIAADAGTLISAWFNFSSTTPATITGFMFATQASAGSGIIDVGLNTNGTLHLHGRNGAPGVSKDGTTVLTANTWYRISVSYVITSTTNWTAKLYINGILEATTSNTDATLLLTGTSDVQIGIVGSSQGGFGTPDTISVYFDSVYVDNRTDLSDCGNIHVTAKRPFANGSANNFVTQIGSGGSGYGTGHAPQVNEQPLSVTNGWSVVAVGATTEEYNIETSTLGDVNIGAVNLVDYLGWIYYKTVLSETPSIVINGVSSAFTSTANTNTMFTKVAGSTAYPVGTGTDIGMVSDATATTVSLYECGIVFAYLLPIGGFLPILGAG